VIDEDLHRYVNTLEREHGGYLYGRRMYELMQAYWPTADTQSDQAVEVEFSKIWKGIPKTVFSSTLERVEGNARLVKTDAVEEVKRLKAEPGKDLEVGGAILAAALMRAGLVDEYRIFVQPVILGAGRSMFPQMAESTSLRLVETHAFGSGVVYLRYERAV
ncbi:MAG TPA: dihydrofolate reductase family protein, partial [Anaerolineaceae bacterium]